MTTYTRKAFYGFAWVALGAVVANLFGYLLRLLLARSLTVEEYGLVYAVMATFGLVSVFQSLGFGEALTKYTSAYSAKGDGKGIKEIVVWAARILYASTLVLAVVAFLLADWLGAVYFKSELAPALIRVFAIVTFLSPLDIIWNGIMQGRQELRLYAAFNMLRSIILFLVTLLLLRLGYGVLGAMLAYLVLYVIIYLTQIPIIVRKIPKSPAAALRWSTAQMLLRYGLPVMLTSTASIVLTYTDTMMITLFSSLDQVGIYQAALPTANILLFAVGVLATVLLPLVAELWEKKRKDLIRQAIQELYLFAFVVILPLAIAAFTYPDLILNLLFGSSFIVGSPILRVLAIAVLFLTLSTINSAALSGIGRPQENTKAVVVGAIINLVSNLILIPRYGGLGAAISTLIAAIVIFALNTYFLARHVHVDVPYMSWLGALVAGVCFVLVLWLSRGITFGMNQYLKAVLVILVGLVVYALCVMLLRVVTVRQVRQLANRIMVKTQ